MRTNQSLSNDLPTVFDFAKIYIENELPVIPLYGVENGSCLCHRIDCNSPGKHPKTLNGLKDHSLNKAMVNSWFSASTNGSNIGIVTGPESCIFVLDIDPRHGGEESYKELQKKVNLPPTPTVRTGGGGWHYYYVYPSGMDVKNIVGLGGYPGIDVRGIGGYVCAPPSVHVSGHRYRWTVLPKHVPFADAPITLLELIKEREEELKKIGVTEDGIIGPGDRNSYLTRLAGALRRQGAGKEEMVVALSEANRIRVRPQLSESEVHAIISSVGRYLPRIVRRKKTIELLKISDLLSEPNEECRWLVDGLLLTGGLSIIAAIPKTGKSTLARQLAICVSRGEPFLGRKVNKGSVLYFNMEEKREEIRGHFHNMGAESESIFVHVGPVSRDEMCKIIDCIEAYSPVLTIIDPLIKLIDIKDINSYSEVSQKMEVIIDLARDTGCHIMCLHHEGKSDRDFYFRLLGSNALYGSVDTLISMRRKSDLRLIQSSQRGGKPLKETILRFDEQTGLMQIDSKYSIPQARYNYEEKE